MALLHVLLNWFCDLELILSIEEFRSWNWQFPRMLLEFSLRIIRWFSPFYFTDCHETI